MFIFVFKGDEAIMILFISLYDWKNHDGFILSFFDRTNKYLKKFLLKSIRPRGYFYRPTLLFVHPVIDSLYLLVGRLIWPVGRNGIL